MNSYGRLFSNQTHEKIFEEDIPNSECKPISLCVFLKDIAILWVLSFKSKVLLYEKIQRFVNKFESHLFKVSESETGFIYFLFVYFLFFYFFPRYNANINKMENGIQNNVTMLKFLWKRVK